MMQKVKLIKLDRRYAGYPTWKYFIEQPWSATDREAKLLFYRWRTWCWEHWGPSKELQQFDNYDMFDNTDCSNSHWCWLHDQHRRPRLYFKTERDAVDFTLHWS